MEEDLESLFYKVINQLSEVPSQNSSQKTNIARESNKKVSASDGFTIPLGVSNHHVHLSQADADSLFGANYTFTKLKDLSQKGQYAMQECLMVAGPKGVIDKVHPWC